LSLPLHYCHILEYITAASTLFTGVCIYDMRRAVTCHDRGADQDGRTLYIYAQSGVQEMRQNTPGRRPEGGREVALVSLKWLQNKDLQALRSGLRTSSLLPLRLTA
jgi:hypothetical protein